MKIDRKAFYDHVRKFQRITQTVVDTVDAMFDEWERRNLTDLRWLAYMLATVRGECGVSMKPVPEIGRGKGKKYGVKDPVTGHVYYGRGLVQLTWAENYKKMGKLIGLPLYENPDLALKPDVAVKILFTGMLLGSFTGRKLADYFTSTKADWFNARRIVNGTDKASQFAAWGKQYLTALEAAGMLPDSPKPEPEPKPVTAPQVTGAGAVGMGAGAVAQHVGMDWGLVILIAVVVAVVALVIIKIVRD